MEIRLSELMIIQMSVKKSPIDFPLVIEKPRRRSVLRFVVLTRRFFCLLDGDPD